MSEEQLVSESTPAAPATNSDAVQAAFDSIIADTQSESLDSELSFDFGDDEDFAPAQSAPQDEAEESAEEEAGGGEAMTLEERVELLQQRFEDTQKWANSLSSELGQVKKKNAELEAGVVEKMTKSEQDALLAELREFNEEDFQDPARLNERVISVADKIVEARAGRKLKEIEQTARQYEQGMQYMAGFMQAGQHAPVLQNAVAFMAQQYAQQNNGKQITDDYSPQQVLAGAWQLVQQQASQNNNSPQPTEQQPQQGNARQQPSSPQPAATQARQTFTPESPSVGLSSGAVTTVTGGEFKDTKSAVDAAFREAMGG